jgi:oligosaccharide repeat unit polymerase
MNRIFATEHRRLLAGLVMVVAVVLGVLWLSQQIDDPEAYAAVCTTFCALLSVGVWSHWRSVFTFNNVSLPGLFVASVFPIVILPLPAVIPLLSEWSWWSWVTVVTVAYTFTLLGIIFVPLAMGRHAAGIRRPHRAVPGEAEVAFFLLIVCCAMSLYWILSVGNFALGAALSGGATTDELKDLREHALKLLDGPVVKVVSYLRNLVFPFTTTMLFVIAFTRKTKLSWLLFAVSFTANFVMAIISLEKLYGVMLLLQMFFAWMLVNSKRVSYGVFVAAGLSVAGIFLLVSWAFLDPETSDVWFEIYSTFIWRIMLAPAAVVGGYIDYFTHNDYLLGQTLPFINKLFEHPVWIENIVCQEYFGGGDTCHANAAYIVYLWADFGWIGVVAGGFTAGLIVSALQRYGMNAKPSAAGAALRATMAVHVLTVGFASLAGFATWAGMGIVFTLAVSVAANLLSGRRPQLSFHRELSVARADVTSG